MGTSLWSRRPAQRTGRQFGGFTRESPWGTRLSGASTLAAGGGGSRKVPVPRRRQAGRQENRCENEKALVTRAFKESGRPGSNRRRPAWEAGILPLNYARRIAEGRCGGRSVNRPRVVNSYSARLRSPLSPNRTNQRPRLPEAEAGSPSSFGDISSRSALNGSPSAGSARLAARAEGAADRRFESPAASSSTTLSEWRPSLGAGSPVRTESTNAAAARASGSSVPPLIVSAAAKALDRHDVGGDGARIGMRVVVEGQGALLEATFVDQHARGADHHDAGALLRREPAQIDVRRDAAGGSAPCRRTCRRCRVADTANGSTRTLSTSSATK